MERQLLYIFLARVLASCIYFGFMPFLVYYVNKVHGYEYKYGVGVLVLVSVFSDIVKFLSGRLLGKYSARTIILITLAVLSLVMWCFQFGASLPIYFTLICGIIVGACFGVFYVFFRVLFSDLSTHGSAVRYHSYMASANNIGLLSGPLIFAGLLGIGQLNSIFQVFSVFGLLSSFFMLLVNENRSETTAVQIGLSTKKFILYVFIANAIYWAILQQIVLNLVVFYSDVFNNAKFGAYFFTVQAIAAAILLPIISKKFEHKKEQGLITLFILGGMLMSVGYFLAGLSSNIWVFTLFLIVMLTLGEAFSIPTINAVITKASSNKQDLGQLFGLLGVSQGLGIIVGHLLGGMLYLKTMQTVGGNWYWIFVGLAGLIFFLIFLICLPNIKDISDR